MSSPGEGTPLEEIALVVPSVERWRAPLETVLGTIGIPFAVEGRVRLGQTPFGQALLALLRFGGSGAAPRPLRVSPLAVLRLHPLARRLSRGQAARRAASPTHETVEAETVQARDGQPLPQLEALERGSAGRGGARAHDRDAARRARARGAAGGRGARGDLRAYDAVGRLLDELDGWRSLGAELGADEVLAALEHAEVRLGSALERGRIAVLDLAGRGRVASTSSSCSASRRARCRVASSPSPFLDDEARGALEQHAGPASFARTRRARALPLLHGVHTRDPPADARPRGRDRRGQPARAEPFWDEVPTLFDPDDVRRWTRRRPLSQLTWGLEEAPTERERLRALALLAATEPGQAEALAAANGWERRLQRARGAFRRETRLRHPSGCSASCRQERRST